MRMDLNYTYSWIMQCAANICAVASNTNAWWHLGPILTPRTIDAISRLPSSMLPLIALRLLAHYLPLTMLPAGLARTKGEAWVVLDPD